MPVRKLSEVKGFKYVGTSPVTLIGFGELNPGDVVPVEKAREFFGEDFNGSLVLVPVTETDVQANQSGGED